MIERDKLIDELINQEESFEFIYNKKNLINIIQFLLNRITIDNIKENDDYILSENQNRLKKEFYDNLISDSNSIEGLWLSFDDIIDFIKVKSFTQNDIKNEIIYEKYITTKEFDDIIDMLYKLYNCVSGFMEE